MQQTEQVNILLVDDQPAKLMSYETVLSELGETLIKASSAREALEKLLKNDIAVILVDVCMPELDGFQLAEMIREHPRFRDTAIVFISAVQLDDYDRLRGYQLGAVDYVPVPIIPDLLRAKVRVFAELYRKTRQLERLNRELEIRVAERTFELQAANSRLQLAMDVARLGTWDWNLNSGQIDWSDSYFSLLGYEPGHVRPSMQAWTERLHPDDRSEVESKLQHAMQAGADYNQVYRSLDSDGSTLWCEARGRVERDSAGRPQRMLGVVMDISQHKLAEERQRLMVQELHHRVKNSLATVQAIAGLTARTAPDVALFFSAFSSRLESLSRTHTMLVAHNWQRIDIKDLLASELGSFQDGNGRRLSCTGPSIYLPSELALSLGLAIHELTTNAIKYGALSVPQGRVEVNWAIKPGPSDERLLALSWVERDGPPVEPPARQGFGSTLLQKVFAGQSGSRTDLKYLSDGLEFHTEIHCQTLPTQAVA